MDAQQLAQAQHDAALVARYRAKAAAYGNTWRTRYWLSSLTDEDRETIRRADGPAQ